MLTVNWKPPRYVVAKSRPGGKVDFFFTIPAHLRPEGWPATVRLPKDAALRTRDRSPAELSAIDRDAAEENRRLDEHRAGIVRGDIPGTIPWLIDRWQKDDRYAYASLSKGTLNQYGMAIRRIELWHKMQPFASAGVVTWPDVIKFLDAFRDRRGMMSLVRAVLRQVFDVGKDYGYVAVNPFAGEEKRVSRRAQKTGRKSFKLWTAERIARAVELCDKAGQPSIGTAILVGFDLMQYPAQILAMRRGVEYRAPYFVYQRTKTGEEGTVRASRIVQDRLEGSGLYLFINEKTARPWVRGSFNNAFRRIMDKDPLTGGLEFRHLRHCGAAEARKSGARWDDIAAIGAWASVKSCEDTISQVIDAHYHIPDYEAADAVMQKREALRATGKGLAERAVIPLRRTPGEQESDT